MATIDFPDWLPIPTRENYGHQHTSPFARTSMATGRARQRRTFQSVPTTTTVRWAFSEPEAQWFEAWFKFDINDGADWFNIDLRTPIGKNAPYECRFIEMYDGPTLFGVDGWSISAQLEIRERPILDQEWFTNGEQFIRYSDVIDYAVNQKWPEA